MEVAGHFNRHFGPGKAIVQAMTSSPMLEALATADKTLLMEGDDYPVGNVNFAEAEAFCRKLT